MYPRNRAGLSAYDDVKRQTTLHITREGVTMNSKRSIVAALCLAAGGVLCTAPAFAGDNEEYISSLPQAKINVIEANVVNALRSGIPGMQADAAQLVRDILDKRPGQSFSACVIPLMAILKNEEADSGTRILAALALDKLQNPKGLFAISRTASFTSDARVQYVCAWLAFERTSAKLTEGKGIASFEPIQEGAE